jgi:hypothetical protein
MWLCRLPSLTVDTPSQPAVNRVRGWPRPVRIRTVHGCFDDGPGPSYRGGSTAVHCSPSSLVSAMGQHSVGLNTASGRAMPVDTIRPQLIERHASWNPYRRERRQLAGLLTRFHERSGPAGGATIWMNGIISALTSSVPAFGRI